MSPPTFVCASTKKNVVSKLLLKNCKELDISVNRNSGNFSVLIIKHILSFLSLNDIHLTVLLTCFLQNV